MIREFHKLLMPFQYEPFNGDYNVNAEFLKLKEKYKVNTIVETGTCLGSSATFFLDNFDRLFTCEISDEFADYSEERLKNHMKKMAYDRVFCMERQSSPDFIRSLKGKVKHNTIFFLDAHWGEHCPLSDELKAIEEIGVRPIIVIHDFKVPMSLLGYDSYNGIDLNYENYYDDIYNIYRYHGGHDYYYNQQAAGAMRGLIYIVPKYMNI